MTVFGWDASDYDWPRGPMDLAAAARDGIVFFTHKATEGTRVFHQHYREAMNRARAAGIPLIGAYWVPRTPGNGGNGSIAEQVGYLLRYLDNETPWWRTHNGFFIQADIEHWGYDTVSGATGLAAVRALRAAQSKHVVLYASHGQYGEALAGAGVPLWNAHYVSRVGHLRDIYPGDDWRPAMGGGHGGWSAYSGQEPAILQFSESATIGSQTGCDANAYRGTLDQLRALLAPSAITTEEDDMRMHQERLPVGTGDDAEVILLYPYDAIARPALSIGCDTAKSNGATAGAFRVAAHLTPGPDRKAGWVILRDVDPALVIDSRDESRQDLTLPLGTDRVSIRRRPLDAADTCNVPATVLTWW